MKKYLLIACLIMFASNICYAQDSTATINTSWTKYAADTSLTFMQIVATCDSEFAAAGYITSDTVSTPGGDTAAADKDYDGSSFYQYLLWKSFWVTRLDMATGKPHSFAIDALSTLTSGLSPTDCGGTSYLQSHITTSPPSALGWTFIGPQNISTSSYGEGHGDGLHQHIGQVDGIIVNSSNTNEIYATDAWGGVWKTSNANLAPNNKWTCLTDHMPSLSGIGVTNLSVDFSSTPHHLFCLAGEPNAKCITDNWNPFALPLHTVGIFYSLDDGATFNYMDISAAITNLATNPIIFMQYWPGNSGSTEKYLFITTKYQIFRLDVTNPLLSVMLRWQI